MTDSKLALRDQIATGVVAGLIAGATDAVFLIAAQMAGGASFAAAASLFAFIASAAIGPGAYANPGVAVPLGIVTHFCVSIGWALGYVYLTRTQPQLVTRPWISGAGFGIVVMLAMDAVLVFAGLFGRPTLASFSTSVVAHILFYGIPVALVVSRILRRA